MNRDPPGQRGILAGGRPFVVHAGWPRKGLGPVTLKVNTRHTPHKSSPSFARRQLHQMTHCQPTDESGNRAPPESLPAPSPSSRSPAPQTQKPCLLLRGARSKRAADKNYASPMLIVLQRTSVCPRPSPALFADSPVFEFASEQTTV